MSKKAVALISGGLDSVLAARIITEQDFDVLGLYFSSAFSKSFGREGETPAARVATSIGIKLRVIDMGQEYIDLIRNPTHGYGKNANPCIDCKIFMLTKAKHMMDEFDATFIVTGEVLGQRPMSQRRDTLQVIERDAGLKGMILRPLSAKHLPPTKAEEAGIVNRELLLDISGRSRNAQLQLAEHYGITGYSAPAGGCLLTDTSFAAKLRDLFAHKPDVTSRDVRLLTIGRHFRLGPGTKVVLGRNKRENDMLFSLAGPGYHLFTPHGFSGPAALLAGESRTAVQHAVGRLILRYSKGISGTIRSIRFGNAIFIPDESTERTAVERMPLGTTDRG